MRKPAVAVAEDTEAAEATWAALAEDTWAASAAGTSGVSAEVTSEVLAAVTWRACALAVEDIISLAATPALVARIPRHTTGRTPAPTEWQAELRSRRRAAFAILRPPH